MSNSKSVDALANMGAHFGEDMNRLKAQQQDSGGDLYEDLVSDITEEPKEADPNDPLQGEQIQYTPDEEMEYHQVQSYPSEEEIHAAETGYPEISEEDEPLFLGGPLKSEIDSWKKQFVGQTVFITEVAGDYFIARTLNRYEYKQIIAIPNTDPLMREEIFCHTCVLWPRPYDWRSMAAGKSGIPSTLATIIMEQSGFIKNYELEVL